MLKFVALWNLKPGVSEAEFEKWYRDVHMPDAKRIPGLRRYTVNRATGAVRGESRYYRMAELSFDSYDAVQRALKTPEWQHAFSDAQSYITDHLRLQFDSEEVPLD
jgi:uncharacterized protein (TIGR02118 family)